MPSFDREKQQFVVRIVYDGLAKVGKTQSLRALYDAYSARAAGELYSPEDTESGRTMYFDWLDLSAGFVDDRPLRAQVLSVPGQFSIVERRVRVLANADAVILVCESTAAGVQSALLAWTMLSVIFAKLQRPRPPVIIQANKQDLPEALSVEDIRAQLAAANCAAPVFGATALVGEGTRLSFVAALSAARDQLRPLLSKGPPETTLARAQSASELFDAMIHDADGSDAVTAAALDAAVSTLTRSTR
ncbi:MAG: hypothetical protein U0269_34600 [Polyangiales bacterium]